MLRLGGGVPRPSAGTPGPPIDVVALQAVLVESSVRELEDLAQAVGEELCRRRARVAEPTLPPWSREEEAGDGLAPAGEAVPPASSRASPPANVRTRPLRVHVTRCGTVWHADPQCGHLFYRGQRRKGIRMGTPTEMAADLRPCRDCSAAWVGVASGPTPPEPFVTRP